MTEPHSEPAANAVSDSTKTAAFMPINYVEKQPENSDITMKMALEYVKNVITSSFINQLINAWSPESSQKHVYVGGN